MPQKRKAEEYHDPDYPLSNQAKNIGHSTNNSIPTVVKTPVPIPKCSDETRREKITTLIKREFANEIKAKEKEIDEIEKRINRGKQLLAKVRYAVVQSYYSKKSLVHSEQELIQAIGNVSEQSSVIAGNSLTEPNRIPIQPAIHPSLKKILGKKPLDYNELLKVRPVREAAKHATQKFIELKKQPTTSTKLKMANITIPADETIPDETVCEGNASITNNLEQLRIPRYVSPNKRENPIPQVNSARGRNASRHLLVVGNTSKYVGHEEKDEVSSITHKWLIYIATKTPTPIEEIVSKVRFFLHESYKPNDIVEVNSPPFHLSKRGWGEFTVRLQLYFHPHIQQKPMQIFHTLVLDKTHTGLQTMGAETVVELWLNLPSTEPNVPPEKFKIESTGPESDIGDMLRMSSRQLDTFPDLKPPLDLFDDSVSKPKCSSTDEKLNSSQKKMNHITPKKSNANSDVTTIKPSQSIVSPMKIINQIVTASLSASASIIPKASTSEVSYTSSVKVPPITLSTPKVVPNGNIKTTTEVPSTIPARSGKTFMKCIDKNGKVSLIEVFVDPNNPKILRMVAPNKSATPTLSPVVNTKPSIQINPNIISSQLKSPLLPKQIRIIKPNVSSVTNTASISSTTISMNSSRSNNTAPSTSQIINPSSSNSTNRLAVSVGTSSSLITKSHQNNSLLHLKSNSVFPINSTVRTVKPNGPQISLLKPQISLLKSAGNEKPNQMPISIDNRNLKVVTVKDIKGLPNKQINVFIGKDCDNEEIIASAGNSKNKKQLDKSKSNRILAENLEKLFWSKQFSNPINAFVWLLRRIPIVTPFAIQTIFQRSFPFTVESDQKYNSLHVGKQRCFEWLRAKYINRLVKRHPNTNISTQVWTTKQIVQYARKFGFTPPSIRIDGNQVSSTETSSNLKELIQSEINREHLQNDTISFNTIVSSWISKTEDQFQINGCKAFSKSNDDDIIDVDNIDSESDAPAKKNVDNNTSLELRTNDTLQMECAWVTEICHSAQIKLQPEEIVPGVSHQSSQIILASVLRSFLEDLLRKAYACGPWKRTNNHSDGVRNEDIQQAIITTNHFDFLTNKHLGVAKINSENSTVIKQEPDKQ